MKLMYLDNLKQQKCFEYEVILNNKWIYNADKVYKGWQSCQETMRIFFLLNSSQAKVCLTQLLVKIIKNSYKFHIETHTLFCRVILIFWITKSL